MDPKKAIELLNSNGKLVKRPFVLTNKRLLVGFNEEEWNEALKS
jgi:arsenate reductase-like glutaredoxin family protein